MFFFSCNNLECSSKCCYILLTFKTGQTGMKPRKGRQLVEFDQTFHPSHRHQIVKVKHLNGSRVKKKQISNYYCGVIGPLRVSGVMPSCLVRCRQSPTDKHQPSWLHRSSHLWDSNCSASQQKRFCPDLFYPQCLQNPTDRLQPV